MASVRITGLSGIDTESLVTQMMDAESQKLTSAQRKLKWYTWQQEAYRSMITTIMGFQSNRLGTTGSNSILSTSSSLFNQMKITQKMGGQETNILNITALGENKPVNFDFEVLQLAQADTYSSRSITGTMNGTDIGTLLGNGVSHVGNGDSFYVTLDGVKREIKIEWDDSNPPWVPDPILNPTPEYASKEDYIVNNINQQLLNYYGSERKEMTYLRTDSGVDVYQDVDGTEYRDDEYTIYESGGKMYTDVAKVSLQPTYDSMSIIGKLHFVFSSPRSFQVDHADTSGVLHNLGFTGGQNITGKFDPAHVTLRDLLEDGTPMNNNLSVKINGVNIKLEADMTFEEMMDRINNSDAGVTMSLDTATNRFKLTSNETGEINRIVFEDPDGIFGDDGLRLVQTKRPQDAIIAIDGEERTLNSNEVIYEGYQIAFDQLTDGKVRVSTGKDVDSIVENIKAFVDEYNTLLATLNDAVTTSRAKDANKNYYDPLTDDEEAEMSESQLDKWNEKAKTGLLYGDTALRSVVTQMRDVMMNPITLADGSKISLYDIGISTTGKDAQGQLTVDEEKLKNVLTGNLEGDNYAGLREILEKNPDAIQQMFSQVSDGTSSEGIARQLNTIMENATSTFSVSSGANAAKGSLVNKAGYEGTRWLNNNYFSRLITEQNNRITKLITSLEKKEERYYKMFSAMEQAVSSNDSLIAMLQSMSGIA